MTVSGESAAVHEKKRSYCEKPKNRPRNTCLPVDFRELQSDSPPPILMLQTEEPDAVFRRFLAAQKINFAANWTKRGSCAAVIAPKVPLETFV